MISKQRRYQVMPLEFRHPEKLEPHDFERFSPQHPFASCLANRAVRDRTERYKWRNGTRDRELTANAVMVLRVLGLICAGMKARIKFGTLHEARKGSKRPRQPKERGREKMRAVRTKIYRTFQGLPKARASVQAMSEVRGARVKARSSEVERVLQP